MLDKSKYRLSGVVEGKGWRLTEIEVTRPDLNPISDEEVEYLLSEFKRIFPDKIYRVRHKTDPAEDDVVLHIYINLTSEEVIRRIGTLGARLAVPKEEVEKQLKDW